MAILIQQQSGCVNVIDTALPAGKQIKLSLALDSIASPFPNNNVDYIQTYDCHGKPTHKIYINGALQYQDLNGSPTVWAGTLDEFCNKLNNEYFTQTVTTTPPVGGSTSAHQLTQIDQTEAKYIGLSFDLTADIDGLWSGYPLLSLSVTINNSIDTDVTADLVGRYSTNVELANALNLVQDKVIFLADPAIPNVLAFSSREYNIENVTSIEIINDNGDSLLYDTFVSTGDSPTGALHQLVQLVQRISSVYTSAIPSEGRIELIPAQSLTFANYKQLEVVCHSPDGAFNFKYGTDTAVSYPYTDPIDGNRLKGVNDDFGNNRTSKALTITNVSAANYFISYKITR